MKRIITKKAEQPISLNTFLKQELGLTKRQISQAKFRPEGILVNGIRKRVSEILCAGDLVAVMLEEEQLEAGHVVPSKELLQIIYEDEDVLAVNKQAGQVVHPSHGHYADTLANSVEAYYRENGKCGIVRPIGRLDKDTSGIVLFAKNQVSAARLARQKEEGVFYKKYHAIISGKPDKPEGTIDIGIEKDPESLMKMRVSENGSDAHTSYRMIKGDENASLLEVAITSGRTHQIRVHMASIGHPLLGDPLYGTKETEGGMVRSALHAGFCHFQQPFSREIIELQVPFPEDMIKFMEKIVTGCEL